MPTHYQTAKMNQQKIKKKKNTKKPPKKGKY